MRAGLEESPIMGFGGPGTAVLGLKSPPNGGLKLLE